MDDLLLLRGGIGLNLLSSSIRVKVDLCGSSPGSVRPPPTVLCSTSSLGLSGMDYLLRRGGFIIRTEGVIIMSGYY